MDGKELQIQFRDAFLRLLLFDLSNDYAIVSRMWKIFTSFVVNYILPRTL